MKKIMLCGNPSCGGCPHVEEDTKKDTIYILDIEANQKITLNKEHQQALAKYLYKRGYGER